MKHATTREAVAALFLERQRLDKPRARKLSAASLVDFARATGGIQLDSINIVDRAHLLTLWSRFGEFDRRRFEALAYERRLLFEYWAHAACLIAADDFPAWRRAMLDYREGDRGWSTFLRRNSRVLAEVESAIRDRGPLGNADFEGRRPRGASPGWWSWKPETHALDFLWMSGRILVSRRVHFQKRYDLAERVLGAALDGEPPTMEAFRRWHLRRALSAMGAATETDLRMYLTFPRTAAAERRRTLTAMIADGEVVEVSVAGDAARWFALREDMRALDRAARRSMPSIGTTFLSPFDSFLWHRERTIRLFDFDYRIEVYTPAPARRHGYYVLPILQDGRLVGRADLRNDRAARRLEVPRIALEPAAERTTSAAGVADALQSLARFVGATSIRIDAASPARFGRELRKKNPS